MAPTYDAMLAQPQRLDPDAGKVLRETHWSATEALKLLAEVPADLEGAQQAVGNDALIAAVQGRLSADLMRAVGMVEEVP